MASRRITLVADEILGYVRTGGIGTATTYLALALARLGHHVEILYSADPPERPLDPRWQEQYARAEVTIRTLDSSQEAVEPPHFARMLTVERALRERSPDLVVVQDLAAPAYTALRLRQLGLAFENTVFVVYCHGTRQWITDMARKVRVLPGALAVSRLEQASVELADIAVSPSEYMLGWMRQQGWRLPDTSVVIPLLTRAGATGEPPPEPARPDGEGRAERIAFFGRLEERKGLRPFAAGLNSLEPHLLVGLELEFIGRSTPQWSPERVQALLADTTRRSLDRISFLTDLDQDEALGRLGRPGTLAVMPSLEDNSPAAVYECLERGIPFLSGGAGGAGELVAAEDRERVLFEPSAEGLVAALRRALADGLRPARAAFDNADSLRRWAEVVDTPPRGLPPPAERPPVDVIVVSSTGGEPLTRCLAALEAQNHPRTNVVVEAEREAGLRAVAGPWVLLLDEEDVAEPDLIETLGRAQAASDADAVTCAVRVHVDGVTQTRYFSGDPGGLALLGNDYGTVGLIRRSSLVGAAADLPEAADPDWLLLARMSAEGARIVSVPTPLVTRTARPGTLAAQPADALQVVQTLESALPRSLRSLARLAAGLAADLRTPPPSGGVVRRAVRVLRDDGALEVTRRVVRRLSREGS